MLFGMSKAILAALALVFVAGCTDEDATIRALTEAGYTEIEPQGYALFGCSDDDTFRTKFAAKGPTGVPVSGAVCCGWLKDCTVRH